MDDKKDDKQEGSSCGCGGGSCCGGPRKWIWIMMIVAVAAVVMAKNAKKSMRPDRGTPGVAGSSAVVAPADAQPMQAAASQKQALPRLVDLGAHSCVPCKMMAPILGELKTEYADVFTTEFIDVWQDPEPGRQYGIRVIPTQIFLCADGKELFRHEGFFGKEDILGKWKELGVERK